MQGFIGNTDHDWYAHLKAAQDRGAAQPDGDAHLESVTAVASSLDGRYVVSGSMDGEVRRWDAASGRVVERWTWDGRERRIDGVAIAGDRVAAAVGDRVRAFDDGEEWTTPRSVWALSSDGEALYAHNRDERYRLDPQGALFRWPPVSPRPGPTTRSRCRSRRRRGARPGSCRATTTGRSIAP